MRPKISLLTAPISSAVFIARDQPEDSGTGVVVVKSRRFFAFQMDLIPTPLDRKHMGYVVLVV